MTSQPEQITDRDRAIAKEAKRLYCESGSGWEPTSIAEIAAYLTRTGWTPTDPLLLEAREFAAQVYEARGWITFAREARQGERDHDYAVQSALLALRSREGKS
jgi:hypothetical protein